jgi:hypothetical protein
VPRLKGFHAGALLVASCVLVAGCTSSATGGKGSATTPASPATSGATSPGSGTAAPGELPAAAAIPGVVYRNETDRSHQNGTVHYDASPPVGGAHSAIPADCSGNVYSDPIASENAVHSLEHGAIWITYRPGLAPADLASLARLVSGQDHVLVSPYPGLSSAISLQSWGYQLALDKVDDPRLVQFVNLLRSNPVTTPEYGASCANPEFKANPSTPGHPTDA